MTEKQYKVMAKVPGHKDHILIQSGSRDYCEGFAYAMELGRPSIEKTLCSEERFFIEEDDRNKNQTKKKLKKIEFSGEDLTRAHHIYHHDDMDGKASAAIIGYALYKFGVRKEDIHYYECSYGQPINTTTVLGGYDRIYMVDFAIQPYSEMEDLISNPNFVWIDHHKTSAEWINTIPPEKLKFTGHVTSGNPEEGAACKVCWELFFDAKIPTFIQMLNDYDIWNKNGEFSWDNEIYPLQLYLKTIDTSPAISSQWWQHRLERALLEVGCRNQLHSISEAEREIVTWIEIGRHLVNYEKARQRRLVLSNGYSAMFYNYNAFIVNSAEAGSSQFEAAIDTSKYDLLVAYHKHEGNCWTVHLYSPKPGINCGNIAKKLGQAGPFKSGGGHEGAAGFQTDTKSLLSLLGIESG